KIYTKALAKQVEQFSNGKILEDLNRAVVFTEFETTALRQWLMQANPPRAVFPPVAEEVAAWIVSQNYEDWQGLVTRLWARAEQVAL
ncbi:hypothetical protein QP445_14440, partial [Micrococcus luteus]|nr:hypothetical protein [Micrococcus luteus]